MRTLLLALSLVVVACSPSTRASFSPASGAPELAPADFPPGIRDNEPPNGKKLGVVEVTGDAVMTTDACQRRMAEEAQQYGANVLVISYAQQGSSDIPTSCHGTAFYVPQL